MVGAASLQGSTIDRYRVGPLLGEGAMGTVFLVEHTVIGRRFALKLLRPEYAADPEAVDRFMNEAKAAGTLGHANICSAVDFGFHQGVPYIVLELLEGVVLTDEIHRLGKLTTRRSIKIARQIASAVHAAHSAGVIHRDLKSDNIFLTDTEEQPDHVKVLDFGISKFLHAPSTSRTQEGAIVGTPEFMAPEQITSADGVDHRSDVYALGVILFHMLTGNKPYELDDMRTLLHRIVHEAPPALAVSPPGLGAYIHQMLAKDPEQRPKTMQDVEDRLSAFAQAPELRGLTTQPIPRVITPIVPTDGGTVARPATSRRWIIVGAVGTFLVAAILYFAVFRRSAAPSAAPVDNQPVASTPTVTPISVSVRTTAANVTFTLRGRAYSDHVEVAPNTVPELVEVMAPGLTTKQYWVTLDRSVTLEPVWEAPVVVATTPDAAVAIATIEPPKPKPPTPPTTKPKIETKPTTVVEAKPPEPTVKPETKPEPPETPHVAEHPPEPPKPPPADAAEPAAIDVGAVRAVVKLKLGDVRTCFERGRMDRADLAGRVVVKLVIAPDGSAGASAVSSSDLAAPTVDSCIVKVVRGLKFANPTGKPAEILYPFVFK